MKRAKLIIKGLREPIFVSEKDGLNARSVVEDSEIDSSQIMRVGNWSGSKGDIRYVFFENETDLDEVDTKHFSDSEMNDFREQIKPFTIQKGGDMYKSRLEDFIVAVKCPGSIYMLPRMKEAVDRVLEGHLDEEEVVREAEKYVDENFVGELTMDGELKFFEHKKAVKLYNDGTFHILINPDKKSLYLELSSKLNEYLKENSNISYSKRMDRKELDILSQTMSVPNFIKDNEIAQ